MQIVGILSADDKSGVVGGGEGGGGGISQSLLDAFVILLVFVMCVTGSLTHITPGRQQSKTLSTIMDKKSIESVSDCHLSPVW